MWLAALARVTSCERDALTSNVQNPVARLVITVDVAIGSMNN